MADLRMLVENLGFRDVRTVLNSGNVVFSLPNNRRADVATRIENALDRKLGVSSRVTVLSANEVAVAVHSNPFEEIADNLSSLLVMVLARPKDKGLLEPLTTKRWHPEALALGKRVAYIWCANGVGESVLWPAVDRALDRTGTVRNMATMKKLLALVRPAR